MANHEELTSLTELLFDLHNNLTVWKNQSSTETGLSPSQINVLEIIGHNYTLKMKDLSTKLGVTTGSLTVMIDRLEKKNLVNRKPSEHDRRSIMVYLTDRGRAIFLTRYRQQLEFINRNIRSLNKADRKLLSSSLRKMLRLIKEDII